MSTLIGWLNQTAESWAGFMLNTSVQLTVFALLVTLVAFAMRRRPAGFLYLVWVLVFVKAMLPPSISIPFLSSDTLVEWVPATLQLDALIYSPPIMGSDQLSLAAVCFLVWLVLSGAAVTLIIMRNLSFYARLRDCPKFESARLPLEFEPYLDRVDVYATEMTDSPFTWGLFRPRIFLPQSAADWPKDKLTAVLMHEIGHVRRWDFFVAFCQAVVRCLFFFHPLVWLANARVLRLREMACDDFAIAKMRGNARRYSQSLLEFLETQNQSRRLPVVANCFHQKKNAMVKRFEYLVNRKEAPMEGVKVKDKLIIAALLVFGVTLSIACSDVMDGNKVVDQKTDKSLEMTSETENGNPASDADVAELIFDDPPTPVGGFQAIIKNLHYPEIARRAGIEGTVVVRTLIDANGAVVKTKILRSLGNNGCDEAAVAALTDTQWQPAKLDDKPVKVWVEIPVVFRLSNKAESGKNPPPPPPPTEAMQQQ